VQLIPQFVCLKCPAIAMVVYIDHEGPFRQACRKVFKFHLLNNVYAHEYGLLNYFFVDVQGALARQVMYLAILFFLPEVIGNLHFVAVMVDLISSVDITYPSFAQHNIQAFEIVDHKFRLIDI
jgi:hypothetical protein